MHCRNLEFFVKASGTRKGSPRHRAESWLGAVAWENDMGNPSRAARRPASNQLSGTRRHCDELYATRCDAMRIKRLVPVWNLSAF